LLETPVPESITDEKECAKWQNEMDQLKEAVEEFELLAADFLEKSTRNVTEEVKDILRRKSDEYELRSIPCRERIEAIKDALFVDRDDEGEADDFGDRVGSDAENSDYDSGDDFEPFDADLDGESEEDTAPVDPDATESEAEESDMPQPAKKRVKLSVCPIHVEVELTTSGKCTECLKKTLADRSAARLSAAAAASVVDAKVDLRDKKVGRESLEAELEVARLIKQLEEEDAAAAKVTKRQLREAAKRDEAARKLVMKEAVRKEKLAAAVARAAEFAGWPKCVEHPTFPVNELGCSFSELTRHERGRAQRKARRGCSARR